MQLPPHSRMPRIAGADISQTAAVFVIATVAILVSGVAIDSRSFWIDEFGTWLISQQPSLATWWKEFLAYPDSDGQLPFYHFFIYGWSKLFGGSEYSLRAANVPWLILTFYGLWKSALPKELRLLWIGALSIHSFTWFYLNEARPYILVMSGAALTCSGLTHLMGAADRRAEASVARGIPLYLTGGTIMVAGSILGALWVASTALALLWLYRANLKVLLVALWSQRLLLLLCFAFALSIVLVALNSFLHGARPSPIKFSVLGVGYGFIELLGMAGIGPGRNELRQVISLVQIIPMAVLAGIGSYVAVNSAQCLPRREFWPLMLAALVPLTMLMFIGELISMRVVGRHFGVLVVPLALGYAYWVYRIPESAIRAALGLIVVMGLVVSSVLIRVSPHHNKDDYARAAALACEGLQPNDIVWWVADPRGGAYYGAVSIQALRTERLRRTDGRWIAIACGSPTWHDPQTSPSPKRIVLSKPDLYDVDGTISSYVAKHRFRKEAEFSTFTIFAGH